MLGDLLQIIDHDLYQPLACRDLGVLRQNIGNTFLREDSYVLLVDGVKIFGLKTKSGQFFLHHVKGFRQSPESGACTDSSPSGDACHGQKLFPGYGDRVHFSHIRKNLVNVAAENRVQCHQDDLIGPECVALAVKEPCDAL